VVVVLVLVLVLVLLLLLLLLLVLVLVLVLVLGAVAAGARERGAVSVSLPALAWLDSADGLVTLELWLESSRVRVGRRMDRMGRSRERSRALDGSTRSLSGMLLRSGSGGGGAGTRSGP
jgi:hypothetical protein